jgi:hypothetical protein
MYYYYLDSVSSAAVAEKRTEMLECCSVNRTLRIPIGLATGPALLSEASLCPVRGENDFDNNHKTNFDLWGLSGQTKITLTDTVNGVASVRRCLGGFGLTYTRRSTRIRWHMRMRNC